jgi:hypothetical protein
LPRIDCQGNSCDEQERQQEQTDKSLADFHARRI